MKTKDMLIGIATLTPCPARLQDRHACGGELEEATNMDDRDTPHVCCPTCDALFRIVVEADPRSLLEVVRQRFGIVVVLERV